MKNERKLELNLFDKRVALLMALPFFIFSLLALAIVLAQNNIEAEVTVAPSSQIHCVPNVLVVGSSVSSILCRIDFDNADVHTILPSSVTLDTTDGCISALTRDTSFGTNGLLFADDHVFVRFSRSEGDSRCFGPPTSTTDFVLVLSGVAGGIPFSGEDDLHYIVSCRDGHVHNLLANVSSIGGDINKLEGGNFFDPSKYSPKTYSLNGFFDCRPSGRIVGDLKFFTKGTLTEPTILLGRFMLPHIFDKKRPVQISVAFDTLDNCAGEKNPLSWECVGKGTLFIDKEQPFQRIRIALDFISVEVNGNVAHIQGIGSSTILVDVDNLQVSKVTIRDSLPKK